MKREIKFRAWILTDDGTPLWKRKIDAPDKWVMYPWDEIFFSDMSPVTGYDSEFPGLDYPDSILMEYTGLKDKNGKEIYEGDILSGYYQDSLDYVEGVFTCSFESGCFVIGLPKGYHPCLCDVFPESQLEIIGNIYENPELISNEI